jgi:hypothetical protein
VQIQADDAELRSRRIARTDGSAGARRVDRQPDACQELGEARVLTDRVDAVVEAYPREAGFLDIAASPKPVECEVNIAERDAHQAQLERWNERGTRQAFDFCYASSRFASFSCCRERADEQASDSV